MESGLEIISWMLCLPLPWCWHGVQGVHSYRLLGAWQICRGQECQEWKPISDLATSVLSEPGVSWLLSLQNTIEQSMLAQTPTVLNLTLGHWQSKNTSRRPSRICATHDRFRRKSAGLECKRSWVKFPALLKEEKDGVYLSGYGDNNTMHFIRIGGKEYEGPTPQMINN